MTSPEALQISPSVDVHSLEQSAWKTLNREDIYQPEIDVGTYGGNYIDWESNLKGLLIGTERNINFVFFPDSMNHTSHWSFLGTMGSLIICDSYESQTTTILN